MTDPAFTVVMPAHNAAATIEAAIASALAQSREDFELIVVDDGSGDETLDVAQRFTGDPRVRVLRQDHAGPSAARNLAIASGSGSYVSMLDSDDLWLPTYLAAVGDALDGEQRAGFAYTDAWVLEDPPGRFRRKTVLRVADPPEPWLDANALLRRLARGNFIINSTVTIRRSALETAGGYNLALAAAGDYELWLRLAASGFGGVLVPDCHAVYRVRPGSIQHGMQGRLRAHHALREVYRLLAEQYDVPIDVSEFARSRMRSIDRRIAKFEREGIVVEARRRLRAGLGRLKRMLLGRLLWLSEPPPETRRALESTRR